jgi:outer membrane protein TolC
LLTIAFIAASSGLGGSSFAGEVASFDFNQIWSMVARGDPALKASQEEAEAAQIGADRAMRHWYPRIYVAGKAFSTNDPATNFVFTLEQRQIGAADFAPSGLNQPGSNFFGQGSLGIDLPLFEGGMKVAWAQAARQGAQAKAWEDKAQSISEFARVAEAFAGLLALVEERKQLLELQNSVQGVMDHYSIGSKGNPVGYSGLLGLKNLKNRIEGLLAQNEAASQSKRSSIAAAAKGLPLEWRPKTDRAREFLGKTFPIVPASSVPAMVQAGKLAAESLSSAKDAERARFLPRVGAFAQGDLYGGSRSSATNYTAGAYLQWDLFSAPNFGAIGEAEHRAAAAEARADAAALKMETERAASLVGVRSAEKALNLLDESAELLSEQTQTARQLFRNGSINALQLVEVLNRHADLLANRRDTELMLSQTKAALFMTTAAEGVSR